MDKASLACEDRQCRITDFILTYINSFEIRKNLLEDHFKIEQWTKLWFQMKKFGQFSVRFSDDNIVLGCRKELWCVRVRGASARGPGFHEWKERLFEFTHTGPLKYCHTEFCPYLAPVTLLRTRCLQEVFARV